MLRIILILKTGDYLAKFSITLPGHINARVKNKEINRLEVAKAFAKSQGITDNAKTIIDWMYTNGLTSGKGVSKDKYIDFGGTDKLKRSQVSAFFKRMDIQGFKTIKAKPVVVKPTPTVPIKDFKLYQPIVGPDYITALKKIASEKDFEFQINPVDENFIRMDKADDVNYLALRVDTFATSDNLDGLIFLKDNKESYLLFVDAMEVFGFRMEDKNDVATKLLEFGKSGKQLIISINGWTVQYKLFKRFNGETAVNIILVSPY